MAEHAGDVTGSSGVRRFSFLRSALWVLVAGVLVWLFHIVFWYGAGRSEFNMHWGIPDRMLAYGEVKLYLLMVVLGLPAGACVAKACAGLPLLETFRWREFFDSRRGLLIPAAVAVLGSFLIAQFVIHYAWFTDDEQAYLLQARLYAKATLTTPALEPSALLRHGFVVEVLPKGGVSQWTGVYPPLQPFLMALSSFLGSFNLSQFLCVGLITYNAARLSAHIFGSPRCGTVTAWLCATSPMLLGLGATYHTSILGTLLSVLSARLLLWNLERGGVQRGIPLGIVAGSIVLARPMEGALVVFLVGVTLLASLGRRVWLRRCGVGEKSPLPVFLSGLGVALGGLVPLCVLVMVNLSLTGHPLQGAYSILEKEIGRFIGFGDDMMWGRSHSPELGVVQTVTSIVRMNAFVYGWPLSLLLVAVSVVRPLRDRRVLVLLGLSAIHFSLYFFLAFGSVHDFGHAYHVWHVPALSMIGAWVLLRSQALGEQDAFFHKAAKGLRFVVLSSVVVAAGIFWPSELTRWRDVSEIVWRPVRAMQEACKGEPCIGLWTSMQPPGTQRTWVFRPPAPHPDANVLWAFDSPPWYPELRKRFPERRFMKLTWHGHDPVVSEVLELPATPSNGAHGAPSPKRTSRPPASSRPRPKASAPAASSATTQ